jgi:hypothetical protein
LHGTTSTYQLLESRSRNLCISTDILNGFLVLCWPCISIYPCNGNQRDTLFILSLFLQSTSTCFGHACISSSGGILYICNNWYVYICIYIHIYSIPPDEGLQIWPKHVELDWRNILRINSASRWLSFYGLLNGIMFMFAVSERFSIPAAVTTQSFSSECLCLKQTPVLVASSFLRRTLTRNLL